MNSYSVLYLAMAQVSATLVGFIGVVFVLGERANGKLNMQEASALFHFMMAGFGALFVSLLGAFLLIWFEGNEVVGWRYANFFSGCVHLIGALKLATEQLRASAGLKLAVFTAGVGIVLGTLSLFISAGFLSIYAPMVFTVATLWALVVTVIAFLSLLTHARTQ